ncbi:DUF397 domain-containing protein [Streptomyces olivaceus]|uniref:DUF397 domain-containing protein n=1 Tax=Streptomyces olivaceus TaxID=47716 RepID=UPI003558B998
MVQEQLQQQQRTRDCIEVAPTALTTHVRDSKRTSGPRSALTPQAWAAFVESSTALEHRRSR